MEGLGPQSSKTFAVVTAVHVTVVLVVILSGFLHFRPRPKPEAVRVKLVSLPAPPAAVEPPAAVPPAIDPPAIDPPAPKPPAPKPPAPKPPVPKPKAVKVPEKPKPKPKPKPRFRTPEEIRRSAALQPARPPKRTTPVAPVNPDDIAKRISKRVSNLKVIAAPGAREQPRSAEIARYYDVIGAKLHAMWEQPSRAEAGGGTPQVTVSIEVRADGRVAGSRVARSSSVMAMNASVIRLLKSLDRLPPFTDYGIEAQSLNVNVVFRLD